MIGRVLLMAVALTFANLAAAEVSISVDRSRLSEDESFTLIIKTSAGENPRQTDFSPLLTAFEVVGQRESSSMSFTNGSRESTRELFITLKPKSSGKLIIPSLSIAGVKTNPIGLMVTERGTSLNASEVFFVEMEADASNVYVQAQLRLTIRIYRAVTIADIRVNEWQIDGAEREQLESSNYSRTIDGVTYQINELNFALYPQQSGELRIPGISLSGRLVTQQRDFYSFGSRGQVIERGADDLIVQVKPIPSAYPAAAWLPAKSLEINENWSTAPENIGIGDSVTRTITLRAEGIRGALLPAIEEPELAGIKIYSDQPSHENVIQNQEVSALGVNSSAWVITESGQFTIPELALPWWDTRADTLRYAKLPARNITIAPTAVPEAAPADASADAESETTGLLSDTTAGVLRLWQLATATTALGWILTFLYFINRGRHRRKTNAPEPASQSEKQAFEKLVKLCNNNHAAASRRQLLLWLKLALEHPTTPGLEDLRRVCGKDSSPLIEELERSLYSDQNTPWQGKKLANALKTERKRQLENKAEKSSRALPALYAS